MQLQILKNLSTPNFFSQMSQLCELQIHQKLGSSSQIHQINGAPQGCSENLWISEVGQNYPPATDYAPTYTSPFVIFFLVRLFPIANRWPPSCPGHRRALAPCAACFSPGLADGLTTAHRHALALLGHAYLCDGLSWTPPICAAIRAASCSMSLPASLGEFLDMEQQLTRANFFCVGSRRGGGAEVVVAAGIKRLILDGVSRCVHMPHPHHGISISVLCGDDSR